MKRLVLLSGWILFLTLGALAQAPVLWLKSGEKGLYLEHKVAPKESFYAIGRLYNVSPRFLATYNKLDLNKGLQIDQKIRIPLTDTNFTQAGNKGTLVYYKVAAGDGLKKVSSSCGNVSFASLRAWNNLSSDALKADSKLIVGFLKTKEMPSVTLQTKIVADEPVTETKPEVKPVQQTDPVKTDPASTVKSVEEKPVEKPAEKPIEKPVEMPVEKPVVTEQPKKTDPVVVRPVDPGPVSSEEGYFKASFDKQTILYPITKNETVTSGIFKTLAGFQDAKYYILIDNVSTGSVIKVVNPVNNKAVYAKVIGEMSGIRQNEGLTVRISNAAASALQITETDKFILRIIY